VKPDFEYEASPYIGHGKSKSFEISQSLEVLQKPDMKAKLAEMNIRIKD
jgi:hypothetical protein